MVNFRKSHKSKKPTYSLDGFVSNSGNISSDTKFKRQFSKNYVPLVGANLDEISNSKDGFLDKNPTLDNSDKVPNDSHYSDSVLSGFNIEDEESTEKKSRFKFFKRRERKKVSLGKKLIRAGSFIVLALIVGAGSILGYGYLKTRQIFRGSGDGAVALQANVDPSLLNGEGDGRVNILILGKGGPEHEAPDLTDTILLASIDPVQNEAALLSVPRDLYVKDPNGGSSKINAIYSNAKQSRLSQSSATDADLQTAEDIGLKAIKQTVSEVLGVPVHYYVMVDFTAFKEAVDVVGGITVDVKEPLYDATMAWLNSGSALIADTGLQTFDGNKALMYSRSRYGSARGDFDRTERQREVILALQQKVLNVGTYSNPFRAIELIDTLGNNVRMDLNGRDELERLYEISKQISPDKFTSVGLADPPNILVVTDNIDGQSVVVPTAGLYQYEDIHSLVRNTIRDAFLKRENSRVVILNGTTTEGLATFREKELKSYGYNIVSIDNAPTTDYLKTKLIDLSGGKNPYTASYLEKRLGVIKTDEKIEGLPTSETADFVIILGSDEALKTTN